MRALLLAAGYGTRLRPITNSLPKCLVVINGRPLLDYWIKLLSDAGICDILINLHYFPELVKSYILNCKYPVNIKVVHEDKLLGTGGTLLKNKLFLKNEPVMLIHADNLSLFDVSAFLNAFYLRDHNVDITMMTFNTDLPENCGIVEINEYGLVSAFYEKVKNPPSNLANAAVYILSPQVIDFIESLNKEEIDFSIDVLPNFIGRINTYHNEIYHRDIGTMKSLMLAQTEYPLVLNKLNSS
jgi:mannose-1-phosphate guanylyltransferase